MNGLRSSLIGVSDLALALSNRPGMTEAELDPISAADIDQTEDSVILSMDVLRVTEKVTPEDIRRTMGYIEIADIRPASGFRMERWPRFSWMWPHNRLRQKIKKGEVRR